MSRPSRRVRPAAAPLGEQLAPDLYYQLLRIAQVPKRPVQKALKFDTRLAVFEDTVRNTRILHELRAWCHKAELFERPPKDAEGLAQLIVSAWHARLLRYRHENSTEALVAAALICATRYVREDAMLANRVYLEHMIQNLKRRKAA